MATAGSIRRLTLLAGRHFDVLRPTMGLQYCDVAEGPPKRIAEAIELIAGKGLRPCEWPRDEMHDLGMKALEAARAYYPDLAPLVEQVNSAYEGLFRPSKNVIERATHVGNGLPKFHSRICSLRRAWPASTPAEIDVVHASAIEIERLAGEFAPRSAAIERELPLTLASYASTPGGEPAVKDRNESLGRRQWLLEQAFFGAGGKQLLAALEAGAFADHPQLSNLASDYMPPQPRVLEQFDRWAFAHRKFFHEAIRQWLPSVLLGYGGFEYPDWSLDEHLPTDVRTAKSVEENIRAMARVVEGEYRRLAGGRPAEFFADQDDDSREGAEFLFARFRNGWSVKGFGEEGHFTDSKGFGQMHALIQCPGASIDCTELHTGSPKLSKQDTVDRETLKKCKERLAEAERDLEAAKLSNDQIAVIDNEEEIERVTEYMQGALGIGNTPREMNSNTRSAKASVQAAIKRVIEQLRGCRPPLRKVADHFARSIRYENGCATYNPETDPGWRTYLTLEAKAEMSAQH